MSKLYIHRVSLLLLDKDNDKSFKEKLIDLHSLMKKNNIKIKPITYESLLLNESFYRKYTESYR